MALLVPEDAAGTAVFGWLDVCGHRLPFRVVGLGDGMRSATLKPGDALQVAGPAGQMVQVQVPLDVAPGGQFAVQMPAAPVGMAAQPGVAMAAQVQAPDPSGVVMAMPAAAHNMIAAQATAVPVPVTTQPSNTSM